MASRSACRRIRTSDDILNEINSSTAGVTAVFNSITGQIELDQRQLGAAEHRARGIRRYQQFPDCIGLDRGERREDDGGSAIGDHGRESRRDVEYLLQKLEHGHQRASGSVAYDLPETRLRRSRSNVTQNTTLLVSAVQAFVSTYNAAVNEINTATAPPIVLAIQPGTNATAQSRSRRRPLGQSPMCGR